MSAALSRVELFDSVPALPDVLATLTSQSSDAWWCAALTDNIVRAAPEGVAWGSDCAPWAETPATRHAPAHTITPAEAVEVLATRDLWPWAVGDDAAPRWWCERCQGCGWLPGWQHCGCVGEPEHEYGHTADPPTLAALVAVASLGVDTLRRAEGLALQLVGRAPRLTFRVMSREAIEDHHASMRGRTVRSDAQMALSLFAHAHADGWRGDWARGDGLHRAWPVLRDIASLGLHLVALDGDRITLAVGAI